MMRFYKGFLFFTLFSVLFFFISCKQSDSSSSSDGEENFNEADNTIEVSKLSKEEVETLFEMVAIVEEGGGVTITGSDDNWSGFYPEVKTKKYDEPKKYVDPKKGVFISGRNVSLSPYAIGKYEVTQNLYGGVMGKNPSYCRDNERYLLLDGEGVDLDRPVENVSWYNAVAFCNELTKLLMEKTDCVYYSDAECQTVYESGDKVFYDPEKKGYRLPTEAEWEFAARGGNVEDEAFKYAYVGGNTETHLDSCGWYKGNLSGSLSSPLVEAETKGYGTHVVGKKKGNSLGIFDMSGNVREWCYDIYNNNPCSDDKSYIEDAGENTDSIIVNPRGAATGSQRVCRGGSWMREDFVCSVAYRASYEPGKAISSIGFRLARSL
ncbi:MAG: formylglycine-generating enzyme family protein [Treponemataceae bacterium]|nr:formylglycine-generating enzyme family protein [Treponemataceae bacterium]